MADHDHDEDNPLQGYFDWQVTTLMLAHDLSNPIPGSVKYRHAADEFYALDAKELSLVAWRYFTTRSPGRWTMRAIPRSESARSVRSTAASE